MPVRSRTHRYLFLMAPGTGCTALAEGVLIPKLDGEWFPKAHIFDQRGNVILDYKHARLNDLRRQGLLSDDETADLFKFTTVRNPFDRLVTDYTRLRTVVRRGLDELSTNPEKVINAVPQIRSPQMRRDVELAVRYPFSVWVQRRFRKRWVRRSLRRPFGPLARRRSLFRRYVDGVDFVMRFERIQEDFNQVLQRIGVDEPIEIPKINVTQAREADYHRYYTPKARAFVERVFSADLERFGYSF
jgi:Sulfotransferase family